MYVGLAVSVIIMQPYYTQKPPEFLVKIGKYHKLVVYVSIKNMGTKNKRFYVKKDKVWQKLSKGESDKVDFFG